MPKKKKVDSVFEGGGIKGIVLVVVEVLVYEGGIGTN